MVEFGIEPQLARAADELPDGDGWAFEPKYDGFRAIVFIDGEEVRIQSRGGKDLLRYFPELRFPRAAAGRLVLDGEIVIEAEGGGEEFGSLQQRIHPAASRVQQLSESHPATFIAFDVLAAGDEDLLELPFAQRRARLEEIGDVRVAPSVRDATLAAPWLETAEGVIAKRLEAPYTPGKRTAMLKIKRRRTLDCVVVGYRPGKAAGTVGSLILGLYTEEGALRPVGHTSSFNAKAKRELLELLAPYETGERGSGEASRWTADERDLEWVALRPELVAEVAYDHASDGRIRHGAKFLRWRDDKRPQECVVTQL
jgi:ATP-dependent DNA ligase